MNGNEYVESIEKCTKLRDMAKANNLDPMLFIEYLKLKEIRSQSSTFHNLKVEVSNSLIDIINISVRCMKTLERGSK